MKKTVESVTEGHPDKVCDQIADALLDEYLRRDTQARTAIEVLGGHGVVFVGGEIATDAEIDVERVVRNVYHEIGYTDEVDVLVHVNHQSPDIAQGVVTGGAGDQGIMYGYATSETPEMLPLPTMYTQALTRRLADVRKHDPLFAWLKPDGKVQMTMDGKTVSTIVVSVQHDPDISEPEIRALIAESVLNPILGDDAMNADIFVNPTGRFVLGGFAADTGVTGRKLATDTYGGLIPHGGGALSGKDATKVDRSAQYMARYAAKALVAANVGKNVFVSVAYAIGRAEPVMLTARTGEGKDVSALLTQHFDFRPRAIIERLGLERPIYRQVSAGGHFGRPGVPWEEIAQI